MFLLFHRGIFRFQPLVVCRSKNSALHQHVPFKLSLHSIRSRVFTSSYDMELHHKVFSTAYNWWTFNIWDSNPTGSRNCCFHPCGFNCQLPEFFCFRRRSMFKVEFVAFSCFLQALGKPHEQVSLINSQGGCLFQTFPGCLCFIHCYTKSWDVNHHESSRVASPWITLKNTPPKHFKQSHICAGKRGRVVAWYLVGFPNRWTVGKYLQQC